METLLCLVWPTALLLHPEARKSESAAGQAEDTVWLLSEHGCSFSQGLHISKPLWAGDSRSTSHLASRMSLALFQGHRLSGGILTLDSNIVEENGGVGLPAKASAADSLTHSAAHRVNTKHSYKEGKSW